MYQRSLVFSALGLLVGCALPVFATEVTFDFEAPTIATTFATSMDGVEPSGAYGCCGAEAVSLVMTMGGLMATVTQEGKRFDVEQNIHTVSRDRPGWGDQSLNSHYLMTPNGGGINDLIIAFHKPVNFVEVMVGDYAGAAGRLQDSDMAALLAFDIADLQLGTTQTVAMDNQADDGGNFVQTSFSIAADGSLAVRPREASNFLANAGRAHKSLY